MAAQDVLENDLTTLGLLTKNGGNYQLSPESAAFLSKRSRAYLGTTARFLLLPELQRCAVILKDVLGHSIEEIAVIVG